MKASHAEDKSESSTKGKTEMADEKEQGEEEEVSPAEDLMREHGVLNRTLLIYEEALRRLSAQKPDLKPEVLRNTASLLRRFIEDYHEKLEEDYLFPRFEKAGHHVALVQVLRQQHDAGRLVTDRILQLATLAALNNSTERSQLIDAMRQYVRMYRPHESREDTVLFPALRKIITAHEYDALGEEFEQKEHQLFGEGGFEEIVDEVASLEKVLGIYDLAQFTPR
jgi:hemerythrin-like domain-containing protein